MGLGDKISNATEDLVGKAKEGLGKLTGNEKLEAEGHLEQGKAAVKEGVEKARDDLREASEDFQQDAARKFNDVADRAEDDRR